MAIAISFLATSTIQNLKNDIIIGVGGGKGCRGRGGGLQGGLQLPNEMLPRVNSGNRLKPAVHHIPIPYWGSRYNNINNNIIIISINH